MLAVTLGSGWSSPTVAAPTCRVGSLQAGDICEVWYRTPTPTDLLAGVEVPGGSSTSEQTDQDGTAMPASVSEGPGGSPSVPTALARTGFPLDSSAAIGLGLVILGAALTVLRGRGTRV